LLQSESDSVRYIWIHPVILHREKTDWGGNALMCIVISSLDDLMVDRSHGHPRGPRWLHDVVSRGMP